MKGFLRASAPACLALALAVLGCGKPKPIKPRKPIPPGTVEMQFTAKVAGPVDLTIDGMRVPVKQVAKKCKRMVISGLPEGKHHLVLLSALDAFGPDQIDVEIAGTQGIFKVLFAQQFNSVLYGKPEPTPPAEGIPGVAARLEP